MNDLDDDLVGEEEIAAGRLGSGSRHAATAASLKLLASYFASAPTWSTTPSRQLSASEPSSDQLAEALRFRVALASARRLERILDDISGRLTFRYQRRQEESVGAVRGRLDVHRYMSDRGRLDVPRRYPVRVIDRDHRTPENILAAYATLWTVHELSESAVFSFLPERSPERREAIARHDSLRRTLEQQSFRRVTAEATNIARRGDLNATLDAAERRIESGHIAHPEPYQELIDWAKRHLEGAAATPGDVEWSFYDERFDPTLFEVWLLEMTAAAITRLVDREPTVVPLWKRGPTPTFRWKLGSVSVRLHYRWGLTDLKPLVWKAKGEPLRGIPDITVVVEDAAANRNVVLVDAKLRRREQRPTEELYKLLGYFDALREPNWRRGAIVYYSPKALVSTAYVDESNGKALLLGVDPVRGDDAAFDLIAAEVMAAIDAVDPSAMSLSNVDTSSEAGIAQMQSYSVQRLLSQAEQLPHGQLAPYERMLETQLPQLWPKLDDETQRILVSAEYFGLTAPDNADFSGPLLGLSASCERLLCGPGALFQRMADRLPDTYLRSPVTLGSAAYLLRNARKPSTPQHFAVAKELISESGDVDVPALLDLGKRLLGVNDGRRAAAHTDLIGKSRWERGRAAILGTSDGSQDGMLPLLAAALKI